MPAPPSPVSPAHTPQIDDGLELRKAAFECLDILLDSGACRGQLDTPTFLQHLQSGLG